MEKRTFRPFSLHDRVKSFRYAFAGIRLMIHSQHNAWIHLFATIVTLILGLFFNISAQEWCIILMAMVSVWTAETLNTAFEFLCDVAQPEFHPLVEKAKDVSAGAVLITALGALAVGITIFSPYVVPQLLVWYYTGIH